MIYDVTNSITPYEYKRLHDSAANTCKSVENAENSVQWMLKGKSLK